MQFPTGPTAAVVNCVCILAPPQKTNEIKRESSASRHRTHAAAKRKKSSNSWVERPPPAETSGMP
jgi:hypothetical protein